MAGNSRKMPILIFALICEHSEVFQLCICTIYSYWLTYYMVLESHFFLCFCDEVLSFHRHTLFTLRFALYYAVDICKSMKWTQMKRQNKKKNYDKPSKCRAQYTLNSAEKYAILICAFCQHQHCTYRYTVDCFNIDHKLECWNVYVVHVCNINVSLSINSETEATEATWFVNSDYIKALLSTDNAIRMASCNEGETEMRLLCHLRIYCQFVASCTHNRQELFVLVVCTLQAFWYLYTPPQPDCDYIKSAHSVHSLRSIDSKYRILYFC